MTNRLTKGALTKLAATMFAAFLCITVCGQAEAAKPNFLFIVVDDQSPFYLKIYDNKSILQTPIIDRLASEGMVFEAAHHMGSWSGAVCTPSRHMIMSGRTVDANEALGIGLVSEVVEGDAVAAAKEFAGAFTGFSLPVLKLARSAVMRAGDMPLAGGQDIEADVGAQAFAMDDAKEGMTAFEEKREAWFKDA